MSRWAVIRNPSQKATGDAAGLALAVPDASKRLEAADDRLPASCLRFARSAVAQSRLLESVDIAFDILGPLQRHLRLYRGDSRIRGEAEKFGERCLRFVEAT